MTKTKTFSDFQRGQGEKEEKKCRRTLKNYREVRKREENRVRNSSAHLTHTGQTPRPRTTRECAGGSAAAPEVTCGPAHRAHVAPAQGGHVFMPLLASEERHPTHAAPARPDASGLQTQHRQVLPKHRGPPATTGKAHPPGERHPGGCHLETPRGDPA